MAHSPRFQQLVAEAKKKIEEISPAVAEEQQQIGAHLIDVREKDEFAQNHARGAVHLSKGVLEWKIEEMIPDLKARIICYCGGGNRSVLAVENLRRMGYENVASMTGGFKAWVNDGRATE